MPVIIRLDGKAFHTFTRGFEKPFDEVMMQTMQQTTLKLCQEIQGCVFGYTQSDEITLVLVDYNTIDTDAWFDYSVQKMCSVAASMCTLYFNKYFISNCCNKINNIEDKAESTENEQKLIKTYERAMLKGAMFDARVFNIPREELINCVLWRIKDSVRNSVSSLAQSKFSHKELHGKNSSQMQDMLMETFGINWNNLSNFEKTGTLVVKDKDDFKMQDVMIKSYADLEKFLTEKNIFF
jgi:tRNA(His) 5'-end guanylyltransferase